MLTAFFVAARIVSNPISNALQKRLAQRQANPIFIIAVTHALLTLAVLPVAWRSGAGQLGGAFWGNIALCATLAVASNVLLVFALRTSDLSVLGPLNAYKSVVSLALGVFLIGELPAAMGMAGVLLIVAGSYFVVDRDAGKSRHGAVAQFLGERGVQLRLAALCLSATEAVFLTKAILAADPDRAEAAMRSHIRNAYSSLAEAFQEDSAALVRDARESEPVRLTPRAARRPRGRA